jgi:hypothetical protein
MKRQDYVLGVIFLVVIVVLPLLIAIPASASMPLLIRGESQIPPTALPTLAPTPIPPTATPIVFEPLPSPTPARSAFAPSDVLSANQLQRLYNASLGYVAKTTDEGIALARSMGYVKNDGHPDSMCGPLSIAILRDAKLLNPYIDLHDYWLLNPNEDRVLLDRTFPVDKFAHYRITTPLDQFDFKTFPLRAGDFLYIYAGAGGNFDHMITVNRVDEAGRAYAVTNYSTTNGYLVDEVMLYDPSQPGKGMVYEWTDRRNSSLGLTGLGGFELWRFNTAIPEPNPSDEHLAGRIDAIIAKYGGDWHIVVKEVGGRVMYARGAEEPIHIASIIKVPIALLFFRSLELQGVLPADYHKYLVDNGDGRTFEQLMYAMLVDSEEDSTARIVQNLRKNDLAIEKNLLGWGLTETKINGRISTASEVATIFEGLYAGKYVTPEARQMILGWLNQYTPADDTRIGILRQYLPDGFKIYNKRGTLIEPILVIADAAVVDVPTPIGHKTFVIATFGFQSDDHPTNDVKLSLATEEMSVAIWNFVSNGGFLDDE